MELEVTVDKVNGEFYEVAHLYTKDGQFVTDVKIPPFQPRVEILCWGSRYFLHVHDKLDDSLVYKEVLAFFVPPEYTVKAV
jgi:hypothetical protein